MNTFFRIAVYLTFGMLFFTLAVNFIQGSFPDAFPIGSGFGQQNITNTTNAVTELTGLSGGMDDMWLYATFFTAAGSILISILVRSFLPVGIWLFSAVFWTSYSRMWSIFSHGGILPADFLLMFTVGITFLFIAAVIGMLTGSG